MLRQQAVVVGDVDEIMHLLDKQKVSWSLRRIHIYLYNIHRILGRYTCTIIQGDSVPAKKRYVTLLFFFFAINRTLFLFLIFCLKTAVLDLKISNAGNTLVDCQSALPCLWSLSQFAERERRPTMLSELPDSCFAWRYWKFASRALFVLFSSNTVPSY